MSQKPQQISVILKTEPYIEGNKKDMMTKINLFDCEIKMYSETLPEIQKLLNMTGDERPLYPSLIYHSNEPAPLIIFEDISPKGYETCSDFGVDYDLSQLAYHRLGQMHAASMVLHENSIDVDYYKKTVFHMNLMGKGLDLFMLNVQSFIDELKTWPGYEMYVEKLLKMFENHNEKGTKTFTPNTPGQGYNVLNHGDFHAKNVMFKNMENPKEAGLYIIDFQVCFYGSPIIDLFYTKYMLTSSDRKEDLILYYYKVFSSSLEQMGFKGKIPTFDDLQNEFKTNGYYDVMLSIHCLPYQIFDMETINIEDLFDPIKSVEVRRTLFRDPKVQAVYKKLLPEFLANGYFDLF